MPVARRADDLGISGPVPATLNHSVAIAASGAGVDDRARDRPPGTPPRPLLSAAVRLIQPCWMRPDRAAKAQPRGTRRFGWAAVPFPVPGTSPTSISYS